LVLTHQETDARYKASQQCVEHLEEQFKATPHSIKASVQNANKDNDQNVTRFKDWDVSDQFALFYLLSAIIGVFIMGASNVYANLLASGQSVFIDNHWLAISLSMLMPCASLSLKFTHHIFDNVQRCGWR